MYAYAHQPHRLVDENVIDSQYRKSGWERANGWRRLNEFAHIAQMTVKCAIWSRTAETVEVAEQDERCVTGNVGTPLGTGKQLCLNEAFAPAETEVRVDDVDLSEIALDHDLNRRAILSAKK